ncbi:MAG: sulfotransferase family protein [Verrucomicrobia bacterium]|nr:sulfotransferase family protein [Verrucomicrobiota bacterium]MDA1069101.1 sulfotransferase family protein [Verrucomicrobiota bacterium]
MTSDSTVRVSLWSGPRNVSTAIMYAFAQREDTIVFDEPLYAHYLSHTNAHQFHPGAEDILRSQNNDGRQVVEEIILGESVEPVRFIKNMAHHLVDLDRSFLKQLKNIILTRDPRDMLLSYSKTIPDFGIVDTGYPQLKSICEELISYGESPLVLDSKNLLEDPEKALRLLCDSLGLTFDPAMLSWEKGPKDFEGIWAPHWYHNIHRSSGFQPYKPKTEPFPEAFRPLLVDCIPIYEYLMRFSVI